MQSSNLQPFLTTHARWRAITQRNPAAHWSFIYGVKTTKVYCRPTCTARIARRANVVYYDTRDQAEKDGFRPCTKCKPDESAFLGQREEIVLRALDLIRLNKDSAKMEGGLKELAKNVGVTPSYLCRVFKKTMGCTLGQYRRDFEVEVGARDATSSTGSPSTIEHELPKWAELAEPLSTISSPLAPFERLHEPSGEHRADRLPEPFSEHPGQSSTGGEQNLDLDFDFSEWLWTEGFDLDNWMVPDTTFARDETYSQAPLQYL